MLAGAVLPVCMLVGAVVMLAGAVVHVGGCCRACWWVLC